MEDYKDKWAELVNSQIENVETFIKTQIEEREFELNEDWDDYDDTMQEFIDESVDSMVPVYNIEILDCATHNIDLALDEPEILAFDGRNCAINIIAGNIYESLREVSEEVWDTYKQLMLDGETHQVLYDLGIDSPKKKK